MAVFVHARANELCPSFARHGQNRPMNAVRVDVDAVDALRLAVQHRPVLEEDDPRVAARIWVWYFRRRHRPRVQFKPGMVGGGTASTSRMTFADVAHSI